MAIVTEGRTRVVLAEDEVLLREGLAGLLERSGFEVVGQAGSGPELIALVREHHPELAIVDIRMPPTHSTEGLDAARVIHEEFPRTAILVLSAHIDVEHAMDLLASGQRSGYLLKSRVTDVDEFIQTLERIVSHHAPDRSASSACIWLKSQATAFATQWDGKHPAKGLTPDGLERWLNEGRQGPPEFGRSKIVQLSAEEWHEDDWSDLGARVDQRP